MENSNSIWDNKFDDLFQNFKKELKKYKKTIKKTTRKTIKGDNEEDNEEDNKGDNEEGNKKNNKEDNEENNEEDETLKKRQKLQKQSVVINPNNCKHPKTKYFNGNPGADGIVDVKIMYIVCELCDKKLVKQESCISYDSVDVLDGEWCAKNGYSNEFEYG